MSENPYLSAAEFDEGPYAGEYDAPPRTSLLAIASLLLAIPCCVPGAGLLAATIGGVSLGLIRNARGRLSGRAPAVIAIFLGLFVTVLQVAIGIGVAQSYAYWTNTMAPVVDQLVVSAAQGDFAKARATLTPDADADVTDERLTQLIQVIEAEAGPIQHVKTNMSDVFEAFARTYRGGSGRMSASQSSVAGANVTPVPFAIISDHGRVLCWALFDDSSLGKGRPVRIADLLVMLPGGQAVALRENSAAADMARAMSATIRTPQDLLNAIGSSSEGSAADKDGAAEAPEKPETHGTPKAPETPNAPDGPGS